ncbi:hypothetical protein ACH35V_09760 [Actinomadura sp. 1N219]|uniref:hypothetical protein n=1 Tax=Actinomadura sp. 1N219 TaxID=3375152 RepID=UPI003797B317
MSRRIKILTGGVIAATMLLPTADATAVYASMTGKVDAYDHRQGRNGDWVTVRDWGGKNWVKAQYKRAGSSKTRTLWNKSGKGTSVSGGKGKNVRNIRVCESLNNKPDPCSGWATGG